MGTTTMTFGEQLRARRGEIGLGLRAFALEAQLDPGNLSRYERGLLLAPQEPAVLDRIARTLKLRPGSAGRTELLDLAAASTGRLPADLLSEPEIVARMPLIFRTLRGKASRAELLRLAERLAR
jgi:transcriptional regulator with XRE-family HTH domain